MTELLTLALIGVSIAACAQPTRTWYRPGATQQDFYMDQGQCKAQAFSVPGGSLLQVALILNSCMQGKGWSLVSAGDLPPANFSITDPNHIIQPSPADRLVYVKPNHPPNS
jgi:hypothetical protein